MSVVFGIHVGVSTSCIAANKDGQTTVLANVAGDRVTPTVVSYNDGELSPGLVSRVPSDNLRYCLRLIGLEKEDLDEAVDGMRNLACKVNVKSNGEAFYEIAGTDGKSAKSISIKEVLCLIYKQIFDTAKSHSGMQQQPAAVLTVPTNFTHKQTDLIREAAVKAGFSVLQVVREPAVALLAYDVGQNAPTPSGKRYCLVFRIGGTSLDASVVSVENGLYRILSVAHRSNLGGEKITELLVNLLADDFKRRYKFDLNESRRSMQKLRIAAEESKRVLSTMTATVCSVESLYDGIDFTCPMSRSRFEIPLANILPQFLNPLEEVLKNADLHVEDINLVILGGGSCKIPQLQLSIANYFRNAEILYSIPPDELLAIGAVKQAVVLKGKELNLAHKDVIFPALKHSLYYKVTENDEEHSKNGQIIGSGTTIPVQKEFTIPITQNTNKISLDIFEKHENDLANTIAQLTMDNLSDETREITGNFHAKKDDTMEICLMEKLSGKTEFVIVGCHDCE